MVDNILKVHGTYIVYAVYFIYFICLLGMGFPTVLFCLDEPNIDLQFNIHHSIRESYTFPPKKHIFTVVH